MNKSDATIRRRYAHAARCSGFARLLIQDGQAAAGAVDLKQLAAKDEAGALLLTAKAYEQTGDPTRASATYRRIYFFAPASAESAEAATAMARSWIKHGGS